MASCRREQRVMPRLAVCVVAVALLLPRIAPAQETQTNSPSQLFAQALAQLVAILAPPANQPPRTFTTTVKVVKAEGLPKEAEGRELELAFQAPDHLRLAANMGPAKLCRLPGRAGSMGLCCRRRSSG